MRLAADVPWAALAGFVALVAFQRLWELRRSARHEQALAQRGGVEHGRGHYPLFVVLHALWPLALIGEVGVLGARPTTAWLLWLALFAVAEALRIAVFRALGPYWTVRIWVVPGIPRVHRGPYRLLRHPNYVAVVIELFAGSMLFGAWRTATAFTALYLALLAIRIPIEERALEGALASARPAPPIVPGRSVG